MTTGHESALRILRTVQPTRHLFDGKRYVPAANTNVALTILKFARAQRIAKLREAKP